VLPKKNCYKGVTCVENVKNDKGEICEIGESLIREGIIDCMYTQRLYDDVEYVVFNLRENG